MNIAVNQISRSACCAVNNLLLADRGTRLIVDPTKSATPKNIWQYYGMRTDTEAYIETLKLCYVPIMLMDFLQQYCISLVKKGEMKGLLKQKSNLVVGICKRYLSQISPNHRDHYIDEMLECFSGIDKLISEDIEKYRYLVMQTMANVYPDLKKRNVYADIWAMLLVLNTMFSYLRTSDTNPDLEMELVFGVVYDQMITAFDGNRKTFCEKELSDVRQSVNILTNRIDKFIGIQDVFDKIAKEEAAQ